MRDHRDTEFSSRNFNKRLKSRPLSSVMLLAVLLFGTANQSAISTVLLAHAALSCREACPVSFAARLKPDELTDIG
ncbi:hypothetical protein [Paraburkholderia fungorum]|uniref:hypothetical protein n=1 Tax=Paraburkholderia fungorum TaxID=134537 RepID=UPI001C7DB8EF|nr:hypothetical protein [Paraburkholderia fungorum]